jgi:cyclophilin family peptidyl-prolyl cis-trans isomerase
MDVKRILALALVAGLLTACSSSADSGEKKDAPKEKPVAVVMETSAGTIKLELYPDKAPITVKNFLSYVDDKFYDGTVFHRVIPTFMIQGGGFETGMDKVKTPRQFQAKEKRTRAPIKNEMPNGLSNVRGTIAMARTNDLNSATAQFFINVADNSRLDRPRYCVFGKVIEGMDVVDKIKKVKTHAIVEEQIEDVPDEDVVIKSVRRAEK